LLGITNTKTVFNGIDTEIFTPPKYSYTEKLTIVSTGRIAKEKNPELLIKIAQNLKILTNNFKLIIIGEGNLLPYISRQIIQYKLEENILLTGHIKNELLPNIYKTANVFITTSTSEVMPLSILERKPADYRIALKTQPGFRYLS
jgi:glycosyltransferase involved in cell wall biosynthesis